MGAVISTGHTGRVLRTSLTRRWGSEARRFLSCQRLGLRLCGRPVVDLIPRRRGSTCYQDMMVFENDQVFLALVSGLERKAWPGFHPDFLSLLTRSLIAAPERA